jgi:phosphohistidine phosphatase
MKILFLMRHAQAEKAFLKSDFEREIEACGIEACNIVGDYLRKIDRVPEVILCSTATRTKQTAEHLTKHLQKEIPTEFINNLYLSEPQTILEELAFLSADINSAMVIAHNPGILQTYLELCAEHNDKDDIDEMMPTCGVVIFQLDIDTWDQVTPTRCKLVSFFKP